MAQREFSQITWDATIEDDCRHLIRLAIREDLDRGHDWTTVALIPADGQGAASLVVRQGGVVAGLQAVPVVLEEMDAHLQWTTELTDGAVVRPGAIAGTLAGHVRDLLVAERLTLNLLGRLSGIATLTHAYVQQIAGTKSRIYDTRKTTPGYRRLEKYAVRCGGGHNHRRGLYDAVLIKDNHLAFGRQAGAGWLLACGSHCRGTPVSGGHSVRATGRGNDCGSGGRHAGPVNSRPPGTPRYRAAG